MSRLKCSKIINTFLFLSSNKILVTKTGTHKMLVRITTREDPDQTASFDLGLHCLSRQFWKATSVHLLYTLQMDKWATSR